MRHTTPGLTLAGLAALLLVACGGGGGSGGGGGGASNTAPIANAGTAQTVTTGVVVTLNGTASSDADGSIASYSWTQTAGTTVTLASAATAQPTFTAPTVVVAATLTFSLIVTDNRGLASAASTVNVTVNPIANGNVVGRVTFARVPFSTAPPNGLNYASPVQQPARGVQVEAWNATPLRLATTTTDELGNYSLSVTTNTTITIHVVARMLRDSSQALPRWDMRVQDGITGNSPYTYTDPTAFSSGAAGATHDVAIPSGIAADGTATGPRPSGPFAILDTVYQGIQTILSADAFTNFPPLILDWGTQNDGTFFTAQGGQHIALLSKLGQDTDEFDQHVIAHEFGHYIEHNFSRADNIGGAHALGDKLDPRVAFGEGFGYAFAAIVLNDPIARDSFFDGTVQRASSFNVETNPSTGCWCSESSVFSLLWDVYDSAADTNDAVALGFLPIWNVLIGPQKTTPAFTTIFSFITALKSGNAASAAAINTLVAAQNIDAASIDAYGSAETHFPSTVPSNAALPVYGIATVGGAAVVMHTVNDAGLSNKLGARRYIRFSLPTSQTITITASSSNTNTPDVDFNVFRNGLLFGSATSPPAPNEKMIFMDAPAGEYLVDVFDCANGCDTPEGTAGDYDLSVTVN